MNDTNKRRKNGRNVKFCRTRMRKQISSCRKELSIIVETGTAGCDNGQLNWKKREVFQKYRMKNAKEFAQLTGTLKRKCKQKPKELEGMKKGKPIIVRIRCLKKILKQFRETWAWRI
jgi:hypothetical protein